MTWILARKTLRDVRTAWIITVVLLFLFQLLWAKVTHRVVVEILASFQALGLSLNALTQTIFSGPGQIVQTLMGGSGIRIDKAQDMMSIAYVHPLTQTILCLWAVGRAAAAIAGEIDRGTAELLLAQPVRRSQVILSQLVVDAITLPTFAISMWLGTIAGAAWVGFVGADEAALRVDIVAFLPALINVVCLLFAVSGSTLAFSAAGRSRGRVLGWATLVILVQFLANVIGQMWPPLEWCRPFTLFYYYQPQPMILEAHWPTLGEVWLRLGVLAAVGTIGFVAALRIFQKRDIPAPL